MNDITNNKDLRFFAAIHVPASRIAGTTIFRAHREISRTDVLRLLMVDLQPGDHFSFVESVVMDFSGGEVAAIHPDLKRELIGRLPKPQQQRRPLGYSVSWGLRKQER
jgi:hypothetical protein